MISARKKQTGLKRRRTLERIDMIRVGIYMRVSSDKQVQEGDSISAQRDALRKYIDKDPEMICVGEYLDDGVSGTKEDRDELQRMLMDVRAGKLDIILVTKLDRLYRSIRHYLNLQDTLDRYRVNWLAIWEPIYDTSTPQGRLIINQMMSIAQFEAENTGQRIRQVQSYKVSQGEVISGSTPVGYRIVDKHLVPDENADIVRQMFEFYSQCGNIDKTIRQFDHYKIFPRTKPSWKFILTNEKYIGKFRDNDQFCQPIISRELFDDVQRKVKMNIKKSQKHTYIFSGLLRCGECGRVMAGTFRRKKNRKEINLKAYRCPAHYGSLNRCDNTKCISEHILERHLLDTTRTALSGLVLTAEINTPTVNDNHLRIAALNRRKDKLKDLYINDLISLDEYKQDRERIMAELSDLDSQKVPEQKDLTQIQELLKQPFEKIYNTFPEDERRYFWRSIIQNIQFDRNRNITVNYLP